MQNNDFAEIVSRTAYTSQPTTRYPEGITWTTTNKMMIPNQWEGYYYEGIKGIKTGSLPDQDVINFRFYRDTRRIYLSARLPRSALPQPRYTGNLSV